MRYLIVDGHSVIFAWPDLRALHGRRTAAAREELTRRLTQYQDASGTHVVVVFDGRGVKTSEVSEPDGIQIFYSKAHQTADAIIERLCARYGQEHDLTVATDDLMEAPNFEVRLTTKNVDERREISAVLKLDQSPVPI